MACATHDLKSEFKAPKQKKTEEEKTTVTVIHQSIMSTYVHVMFRFRTITSALPLWKKM